MSMPAVVGGAGFTTVFVNDHSGDRNRSTAFIRWPSPHSVSRCQAACAPGPASPASTPGVGRTMVLGRRQRTPGIPSHRRHRRSRPGVGIQVEHRMRRCPLSSFMRPTNPGLARGFSIQTVSPLPIGWAEHVLADGHWGRALREYMRDYSHWGSSACSTNCSRTPTTASLSRPRPTPTVSPSPRWTTRCRTTTRPTWPTPRR
jgi:hypothetical protein